MKMTAESVAETFSELQVLYRERVLCVESWRAVCAYNRHVLTVFVSQVHRIVGVWGTV